MFGSQPRRVYPTSAGGGMRQPPGGRMAPKPLMMNYSTPYGMTGGYSDYGADDYSAYQGGYAPPYGVGGGGGGGSMKKTGISSDTNSRDPKDLKSRVFVGNVNTQLVDKLQLEKIYGRFGPLKAISVHKGFAFIQFSNEADARTAVQYTDGMSLVGQELDVNMANEPKPDRSAKSGNALKRIKMDSDPPLRQVVQQPSQIPPTQPQSVPVEPQTQAQLPELLDTTSPIVPCVEEPTVDPTEFVNYDTPDTLICGRCRQSFSQLTAFRDHKKQTCELSTNTDPIQMPVEEPHNGDVKPVMESDPGQLRCFICKCDSQFGSWTLLQHLSVQHNMTVWIADRKEEPM